jgi:hypothetical protein
MKNLKSITILILSAAIIVSGCSSMKRSTKGAAIGTAAGGAPWVLLSEELQVMQDLEQ